MDERVPATFGAVFTVSGAFAIGWAIHQVFIQGTLGPTSPPAVFATAIGAFAIWFGRRLERGFDPSSFVVDTEDDEDEEEFDERFSPVSEEMLEGRERDDS